MQSGDEPGALSPRRPPSRLPPLKEGKDPDRGLVHRELPAGMKGVGLCRLRCGSLPGAGRALRSRNICR